MSDFKQIRSCLQLGWRLLRSRRKQQQKCSLPIESTAKKMDRSRDRDELHFREGMCHLKKRSIKYSFVKDPIYYDS